MSRKIIACQVMKQEILSIPADGKVDYEFLPMELHNYPKRLRMELQNCLEQAAGYEKIILGYGLCGLATESLQATNCSVVRLKTHDCIPLFLGSSGKYEQIKAYEKTYFLTAGWTEGKRAILGEYERICQKYGENKAHKVLKRMFDGYSCLVFINTSTNQSRNALARQYAMKVAELLELDYKEQNGELTFFSSLVNGPWGEDKFSNVAIREPESSGKLEHLVGIN